MTSRTRTEQEAFWAGEFGDAYSQRNVGEAWVQSNRALFSEALYELQIDSVLELGANIGLNLRALQSLLPNADLAAVEINESAVRELAETGCQVHHTSVLDFAPERTFDLVFTKGVLIHVAPEELSRFYDVMYASSGRYIFLAEYFSPRPEMIPYRGEIDRLFRRDFAGELLERFPDLRLLRTGFASRHGRHPQDDLTWFLMEKGDA